MAQDDNPVHTKKLLAMFARSSTASFTRSDARTNIPGPSSLEGARGLRALAGLLAWESFSEAPSHVVLTQWLDASSSSLTAAGPPRNCTGFPLRAARMVMRAATKAYVVKRGTIGTDHTCECRQIRNAKYDRAEREVKIFAVLIFRAQLRG